MFNTHVNSSMISEKQINVLIVQGKEFISIFFHALFFSLILHLLHYVSKFTFIKPQKKSKNHKLLLAF